MNQFQESQEINEFKMLNVFLSIEFWALFASFVAIGISFWAASTSNKTAKIEVLDSLQNLTIMKAKECNQLFYVDVILVGNESINDQLIANKNIDAISEVFITKELIDKALGKFGYKDFEFLYHQFWKQLGTTFRQFIANTDFSNYPAETQWHVEIIRNDIIAAAEK